MVLKSVVKKHQTLQFFIESIRGKKLDVMNDGKEGKGRKWVLAEAAMRFTDLDAVNPQEYSDDRRRILQDRSRRRADRSETARKVKKDNTNK